MNKITIEELKALVRKATFEPNWFCSEILRSPNDIWQQEVFDVVADLDRVRFGLKTAFNHDLKNRLTIRALHGPGKTHVMAKLAHWWNFTRKGLIPVTATKQKQVLTRFFPEFRRIYNKAPEYYQTFINIQATKITWFDDPDWCLFAETASVPENLAGLHADNLLFLIDEASGERIDKMIQTIEGALTTPDSFLVEIGNPTRSVGEFYTSHRSPKTEKLYYRMHVKLADTNRVSHKWVNDMKLKWGEGSQVYKIRVLGEFADMSDGQLISVEWVENNIEAEIDPWENKEHPSYRISIDVADGGEDYTVITLGKMYDSGVVVIKQTRHQFPKSQSPVLAAEQALQTMKEYNLNINNCDFVVDSLGVGAGTAGILIKMNCVVVDYRGGESSDNNQKWKNRRTQSYIGLRDAFQLDKIKILSTAINDQEHLEDLKNQLYSIKTKVSNERVDELEPKRLLEKSPDCADGLAMLYATQRPYHQEIEGEFIVLRTSVL